MMMKMSSTKLAIAMLFVAVLLFALPDASQGKGQAKEKHDAAGGKGNGRQGGKGDGDHGHHKGNGGQGKGKGKGNSRPILEGCPQLETIARDITWSRVAADPTLAPKLLRMHFHDCFVRGCDGSILLDSTATNSAEKDAIPNLSVAGYDVIDQIKARLEVVCPATVSCADILTLAARDAVSFQFKRPMWPVVMGRKDGRVSIADEALSNMPSPFENITSLITQFQAKGLDRQDLVVLSGAHTIGVSHCGIISSRLFNFTGAGDTDPSIAAGYANTLKARCSNLGANADPAIEMDPGSSNSFDADYYRGLVQRQGLLQTDAALMTDRRSALLSRVLGGNEQLFYAMFARSMLKMGAIRGVGAGEIRNNCHFVN